MLHTLTAAQVGINWLPTPCFLLLFFFIPIQMDRDFQGATAPAALNNILRWFVTNTSIPLSGKLSSAVFQRHKFVTDYMDSV